MSNLSQVRFKAIFHDHLNMFHLKSSLLEVGYLRFTCDPQVAMPTTPPEASLKKKNVEDKEEGQETADDATEDTSEDDRLLQQKLSENFQAQDPYIEIGGDEDQEMMEDVKEETQDQGEEEEEEAQETDTAKEEYWLEGSEEEEADLDQANQTENADMEAAQEPGNVILKEEEDQDEEENLDHEPDDPPRFSIGGGSRRSPRSRSRKRRRRRSKAPRSSPSPDFAEFPGYHFIFLGGG